MREIILSQGKVALVDDADFERVNQFKWTASEQPNGRGFRAVRFVKGSPIYLHRFIMECPAGLEVDHQNRDCLDNQRSNLRIATRAQNSQNRGMQSNNTTGVKGVIFNKQFSKYEACIYANGKKHYLGRFADIQDAAAAYTKAAKELHGEFVGV